MRNIQTEQLIIDMIRNLGFREVIAKERSNIFGEHIEFVDRSEECTILLIFQEDIRIKIEFFKYIKCDDTIVVYDRILCKNAIYKNYFNPLFIYVIFSEIEQYHTSYFKDSTTTEEKIKRCISNLKQLTYDLCTNKNAVPEESLLSDAITSTMLKCGYVKLIWLDPELRIDSKNELSYIFTKRSGAYEKTETIFLRYNAEDNVLIELYKDSTNFIVNIRTHDDIKITGNDIVIPKLEEFINKTISSYLCLDCSGNDNKDNSSIEHANKEPKYVVNDEMVKYLSENLTLEIASVDKVLQIAIVLEGKQIMVSDILFRKDMTPYK